MFVRFRRFVVLLAVGLLVGVVSPVGAGVAQEPGPVDDLVPLESSEGTVVDLPELRDPWESELDLSVPVYEPSGEALKPGLPVVEESVTVGVGKSLAVFAELPLSVSVDRDKSVDDVTVDVAVLDEKAAAGLSPVGAALEVALSSNKEGAVVPSEAVSFELDYSDVGLTSGADFIGRLRMLQYDGCAPAKEPIGALVCDRVRVLDSSNDVKSRIVSFALAEQPRVEIPARGVDAVLLPSTGVTVVAMAAAASSASAGDFTATQFSSVVDYQVGLFAGSAETSYPVAVPPASAGSAPSVVLSYSSGSVDGMHPVSNNQPGWIGLGWSYHPGAITRAFKSCTVGSNVHQCPDSDDSDNYILQLGGTASPLVQVGSTNEFRLQNDPMWKVIRKTDGPSGHPDVDDVYWQVTTPDGSVFTFGREIEKTSNDDLNSVQYVPVYSTAECGSTTPCQRAYQWNLDRSEDPSGNVTSFFYELEINYYGTSNWEYVRAASLARIEYAKVAGSEDDDDHSARVLFNTEWRCGDEDSTFSDCETDFDLTDVPPDLSCAETGTCAQEAPTFWSERRLGSIQGQVRASATDPWITASFVDLHQWFPDVGMDPDTGNADVSVEPMLWLQRIYDRGNHSLKATDDTPYGFSAFEQLEAEYYSAENSTALVAAVDMPDIGGGRAVWSIGTSDWIKFDDVDFGDGVSEVLVRASAAADNSTISFATLEAGTPFASVNISNNGYSTYQLVKDTSVSGAPSGVTDLYVQFSGSLHLNWFRFKPEASETAFGDGNPHTVHYPAAEAPALPNRADTLYQSSGLEMMRLGAIENEINGEVTFEYGQDYDCVGEDQPLGGNNAYQEFHCYPVWDIVDDEWTYMNKWVVKELTVEHPATAFSATTEYEYGEPRWAKDISPVTPLNYTTWNVFRGHPWVEVTHPDDTISKHWFYQGMNHDLVPTCTSTSCPERTSQNAPSPSGVTPEPSLDEYWLVGRPSVTQFFADSSDLTSNASLTWSLTEYDDDTAFDAVQVTAGFGHRDAARFIAPSRAESHQRTVATSSSWLDTATEFFYDIYGNTIGEKYHGDTDRTGDESYLQRSYFYNTTDWMVGYPSTERLWETSTPGTPGDGNELWVTLNIYDTGDWDDYPTKGLVTQRQDWIERGSPDDKAVSNYAYDSRGRLTTATDADGSKTTTDYDPFTGEVNWVKNHLNHKTDFDYDVYQRLDEIEDPNGNTTTADLDDHGRVTAIQSPGTDTDIAKYEYLDTLNPVSLKTESYVDGDWVTSYVLVDGFGRQVQAEASSPSPTHPRVVTRTIYDDMGRVSRTTEPYNDSTTLGDGIDSISWANTDVWHYLHYNSLGQLIEDEFMEGNVSQWSTETVLGVASMLTINETGSSVTRTTTSSKVTDPNGNETYYYRDASGNLVRVDEWMDGSNYAQTKYGYDDAGRLKWVEDEDGNDTSINYDMLGRKTDMTDPDMGTWHYQYDDVGNLTAQDDGDSDTTWDLWFQYDALHRMTKKATDSGFGVNSLIAEWGYDTTYQGLPEWSKSYTDIGTIQVDYDTYDEGNRLTQQTWTVPGDFGGAFEMDWDYDLAGNLIEVTYPSAGGSRETVEYTYNDQGLPETAIGDDTYAGATGYTEWGALASMTLGSGSDTMNRTLSYHSNRRLNQMQASDPGVTGNQFDVQMLDYDNSGNILAIKDAGNSGQVQCYTYDDLDRLTAAFTADDTNCGSHNSSVGSYPYNHSFTYDELGNLKTRTDMPGTYTYGAGSAGPHAVTAIGTSGSTGSFTYDDNGNMKNADPARPVTDSGVDDRQPARQGCRGCNDDVAHL